ncbi:MAG: hypothetical protein J6T57_00995 [Alphaproteobacteria bacterium]|nr:hypothetical protein [Alphaproteobacteria bacterium]
MKKISKYALGAMVSMSLFMQNAMAANDGLCDLIKGLSPVIKTLRTLAFVGAAFVLMDWAWGWIQKGEVGKDDVKNKGIALFVGFFVLFGVGMLLTFIMSSTGQDKICDIGAAFK